jgi:hypothetical protein
MNKFFEGVKEIILAEYMSTGERILHYITLTSLLTGVVYFTYAAIERYNDPKTQPTINERIEQIIERLEKLEAQ